MKVWRVELSNINYEGWGVVLLDETGMFTCVSDWGKYSHWFCHFSNDKNYDFRRWICRPSDEYLLSKFSSKSEFNLERTIIKLKECILGMRRENDIDKDTAREEFNYVRAIENEVDLNFWYRDTNINDPYELAVWEYPSDAVNFVRKLMPRLREELRKQMKQERGIHTYIPW